MVKLDPTKFRVSSALKTIIGKELITDDFIAVFELVKNSFDANAKRVDVIFEDIYGNNPKLIIRDNGKGMDLTAIVEKWLFVAYSAKKEGTEDYRDKIRSSRIHAGAKGIGRFSCDKLGKYLTLYTQKKEGDLNKLTINWEDFEQDSQKEFINVKVNHAQVNSVPYKNFTRGTILEITGLREEWDRSKLLKLRYSLEKLINPNQENDPHGFSIYLQVKEEKTKDSECIQKKKLRDIVNGKIENLLLDDLENKTTKITSSISDDGEIITTSLIDKGNLIYQIKEGNPYSILSNINITLFYLSQPTKAFFTRKMGVDSVSYGSVFLYKNGFRIYPFGEEGEDPLKIDRRKAQGYARFLGTREIIGRIEINGINEDFKETSSRDGGLIRNKHYGSLEKYFYDYVLKRLEKFVTDVIKWGRFGELEQLRKNDPKEIKKQIADIILNLSNSKDVIDIHYDKKFVDILEQRTEKNLNKILSNLQKIAEKTDNDLVSKDIRRAQRKFNSLLKAKNEAEAGEEIANTKAQKAEDIAEQTVSQNLFLKAAIPHDVKFLENLSHSIGMYANSMSDDIRDILSELRRDKIRKNVIYDAIKNISYHTNTIQSLTKFASKAAFKIESAKIKKDMLSFIQQHLVHVASQAYKKEMKISFRQQVKGSFVAVFRPIEITIILDNLLSNSYKNKAREFVLDVESIKDDTIKIVISDNGNGVPNKVKKTLFDMGISTTSGSGLGLYHIKEILGEMGGSIEYNDEYKNGAQFIITIGRQK